MPDDRLRLIFTCCHPALPLEARVALTLRTLCGLTVEEIAHAFGATEAATAKRLVRARQKIQRAGIPYRVPSGAALPDRLTGVLAVLYLLFTEGYAPSGGDGGGAAGAVGGGDPADHACSPTCCRTSRRCSACSRSSASRTRAGAARTAADGSLVPLDEQDRGRGRRRRSRRGSGRSRRRSGIARTPGRPPAGAHRGAPRAVADDGTVDRAAIVAEYTALTEMNPSPHLALARAVAVGLADGPDAGLALVAALERAGALPPGAVAARGARGPPPARRSARGRGGGLPARPGARAHGAGAHVPHPPPPRGHRRLSRNPRNLGTRCESADSHRPGPTVRR